MKLTQVIEDYVALRRSTGARFTTAAKELGSLARAVGPIDIGDVTPEAVQAFLAATGVIRSSWHTKYYALVGLFRFAAQRGLVSAAPLPDLVPKRPAYAEPYIYSTDELRRLLQATDTFDGLHSPHRASIPAATFRTLILLLYGAGLRLSEALALTVDDVDLTASQLTVRHTKFFKTRLLPVGPKLAAALRRHADRRGALSDRPPATAAFLLRRNGSAIPRHCAERYFRMLRTRVGIQRQDGAYFQPRLHDLRDAFAVHRLVAWYRQGADVQHLLPKLSAYLGHVRLSDTQPYLTMTADLLREAGRRFERYAHPEDS